MQLALNFSPGLTAQFRSLHEVCSATVYSHRGGVTAVAGIIDMAPSDLQRRLNPADEGRPLTADQMDAIIAATGDKRPIYWLIEKHLQDPGARKAQAMEQFVAVMGVAVELANQAGLVVGKKR